MTSWSLWVRWWWETFNMGFGNSLETEARVAFRERTPAHLDQVSRRPRVSAWNIVGVWPRQRPHAFRLAVLEPMTETKTVNARQFIAGERSYFVPREEKNHWHGPLVADGRQTRSRRRPWSDNLNSILLSFFLAENLRKSFPQNFIKEKDKEFTRRKEKDEKQNKNQKNRIWYEAWK